MRTLGVISLFAIGLATIAPLHAASGGHVGGGDAVFCVQRAPHFTFDGLYTLDYVLNFFNDENPQLTTLRESIQRIRGLIAKNTPERLSSFDDFFESVNLESQGKNLFRNTANRTWIPASGPMEKIPDANVRILPENCRREDLHATFGWLEQVVVRRSSDSRVVYKYSEPILSDLISRQASQISYLLVHEWLWDVYQGMDQASPRIRRANGYLHSRAPETALPQTFRQQVFEAVPGL